MEEEEDVVEVEVVVEEATAKEEVIREVASEARVATAITAKVDMERATSNKAMVVVVVEVTTATPEDTNNRASVKIMAAVMAVDQWDGVVVETDQDLTVVGVVVATVEVVAATAGAEQFKTFLHH